MAGPLRGGGGVKGRAIKEPFFQSYKVSTAIKLEGGGGLCLNGPAIKRRTFFCGFPNSHYVNDKWRRLIYNKN